MTSKKERKKPAKKLSRNDNEKASESNELQKGRRKDQPGQGRKEPEEQRRNGQSTCDNLERAEEEEVAGGKGFETGKKEGMNRSESEETPPGRKDSFRRRFGALLRKGGSELPAVINRSLQPIKRSLSFNKDLHRLRESSSARWYSSLGSLAEVPGSENEFEPSNEREFFSPRTQITRTRSLLDRSLMNQGQKSNTVSIRIAPCYARPTKHYNSNIDLNKPPCRVGSLPTLILSTPAFIGQQDDVELKLPYGSSGLRSIRNGWENWRRVSTGNLSVQCSDHPQTKLRKSVRSRSLTQLDSLSSSMLDTGEHRLDSAPPPLEQQQYHQLHNHHQYHHLHRKQQQNQNQQPRPQQPQQPSYYQHQIQQIHQIHPQNVVEASPRFLVPSATFDTGHSNRRHKLSRSQVTSSEYFSVSFETADDYTVFDREEFLPATKGIYLVEALNSVCERRGIDISQVEVIDNFSSPLPILTTDTSNLGGKHLRLTVREEKLNPRLSSQKTNQSVSLRKTNSGSYRGGRSGRFFSSSTEDSGLDSEANSTTTATAKTCSGGASIKASKQRWSGFFGNTKGTKLDLLAAQLDEYNKHGVPRLADAELPLNENGLYDLEEDWRDIVRNSEELSEKQQQQQTALWELVQTEAAYIKTLKVVTDLFMACLCNLQASNILNEVDKTKLFSNVPDIYAANRYFWMEHLLVMINVSRSRGQALDPSHLLQGFVTFEQTFAPYTRYCTEQSKCQQYCRDRLSDNQLFTVYLVWCETRKDCNRLKLLDILVKPMQRLTKYALLLKAVHKNTQNEEQQADLVHMIKSVDDFVASVNAAVKSNEEAARLADAASRLESYDVVESKDEELDKLIKIYSSFDITTASMPACFKDTQRALLREGDLKLKDSSTNKMEVHVLLLTDMLLICKSSAKRASSSGSGSGGGGGSCGGGSSGSGGSGAGGLKIVRQPYVVDRIRIHDLKESSSLGLIYLNEYGTASAAFVLSAGEPKLAKSWMESLRKAQQQFALMKVVPFSNVTNFDTVSRQPSAYLGDVDFEAEECEGTSKTPRGSSRASRVSSLVHSHSSSMEMEGLSPGSSSFLPSYNPSRNVSVETNEPLRASSISSEEGGDGGSSSGYNQRCLQTSSNKFDSRRFHLSNSPTPNTLSVQVPAYSSLGQSLPNLTLATSPQTSTVSPTPPNSLLIVPQITKNKDALLSPGHRGISYPPPSPPRGALRRAFAIPQSRNPPLIKTRHVNTSSTQTIQPTVSLDTETIEERRRRLEFSHRLPSTSSIKDEKDTGRQINQGLT